MKRAKYLKITKGADGHRHAWVPIRRKPTYRLRRRIALPAEAEILVRWHKARWEGR